MFNSPQQNGHQQTVALFSADRMNVRSQSYGCEAGQARSVNRLAADCSRFGLRSLAARYVEYFSFRSVSASCWYIWDRDKMLLNPLPSLSLQVSRTRLVAWCVHEMPQTFASTCFIPPRRRGMPLAQMRRTMTSGALRVSAWRGAVSSAAERVARGEDYPLLEMSYDSIETNVKVGFEVFTAVMMKKIALACDAV